jgi:hypothetical protein
MGRSPRASSLRLPEGGRPWVAPLRLERRARWLSLLTAALLLVVVGSGIVIRVTGGADDRRQVTKAQYEREVRKVYAGVQRAFRATNVRTGLAGRVAAAQRELREAADDLESVEPPAAVRGQNLVIVRGFREYADDLEVVREAAAVGNTKRIEAFNLRLPSNEALARIAQAAEEMTYEAGYDLGPIAKD